MLLSQGIGLHAFKCTILNSFEPSNAGSLRPVLPNATERERKNKFLIRFAIVGRDHDRKTVKHDLIVLIVYDEAPAKNAPEGLQPV